MKYFAQSKSVVLWLCGTISVLGSQLVSHDDSFVPDHVLRITARNISLACESRYSLVVNGTSPGPQIRLRPTGASWIRVYNDVDNANLTMHWHGLAQRMAPFSDGNPATQWPIPPLSFFDYEVQAVPNDAGTYFYHSHIGVQALTAGGPLVVEDEGAPPYEYDEERVLYVGDYFTQTDAEIESKLEGLPFVWPGDINAILLNGKGVLPNISVGVTPSCQLPTVDIEAGKTYRFRFIGATGLAHTVLAMEGHNLTIIGVDGGQYTQPSVVDYLSLGSGQRFDVLFTAKTLDELAAEARSTYSIQMESRDRLPTKLNYGVLRYTNTDICAAYPLLPPANPPVSIPDRTFNFVEGNALRPLVPHADFPSLADVTRRVTITTQQYFTEEGHRIWTLNNQTWTDKSATAPLLVEIYTQGEAALPSFETALQNNGYDPATRAYAARPGEVLEIVFQNTGSLIDGTVDVHPIHFHGNHFFDCGSGNGTYDAEANEARLVADGIQPLKRDTSSLHQYVPVAGAAVDAGWRVMRIRVDAPGVWLIHCHTLQHMLMGMQTVWAVGTAEQIQDIPTDLSAGYLTFGGDVYGNATHSPQVYEAFDHS